MRAIVSVAMLLVTASATSFGQMSHVDVKVLSVPASVLRISRDPVNVVSNLPKDTPVTKVTVPENKIPKNPSPTEAGKFLLAKGVACCRPLEHAHDNWYWCCDKAKLIQIDSDSQSAKTALEKVLYQASKLDETSWAQIRAGGDRTPAPAKAAHAKPH
jgi:hypothetical protein